MKEASARIKINKLLEAAGWRFFGNEQGPANIRLEPGVVLTETAFDEIGENFEKSSKGYVDFLLLNEKGFPLVVLEAKAENKDPLVGKEQARRSHAVSIAALSSSLTETSITSGISSAAIHPLSRLSLHRPLLSASRKSRLIHRS